MSTIARPERQDIPLFFWSRIDASADASACWPWLKYRNKSGYGFLTFHNQAWLAHRLVYAFIHGSIPDGLCVCHTCDNRACCNPFHLWLGSIADNNRDMNAKGRGSMQIYHLTRGSLNGQAKLKEQDVISIRQRYVPRQTTLLSLALEYGVTESLIHCIIKRKAWAHVP